MLSAHEHWFQSCCYGKWPQGGSMSLCPTPVTEGNRALFLDCQLERNVSEKHLRLMSHSFFLLYPYPLAKSQFLKHHSVESAFIHRWGDPKEGGWRWEPHHQEKGSPWGFSKLFPPSFIASGGGGPMQRGLGSPGPWGRAHWLAHPPQLCQPHDSPSLGTKPAQASGMWHQPRSPRPEGNRVDILLL